MSHRPRRHRRPPVLTQRGSSTPKAIFNLPPKKIIKATKSYAAEKTGELSFEKGDFFYVIHDKPTEQIYEVINPVERKRGLVKYKYFANIAKNAAENSENYNNRETGLFDERQEALTREYDREYEKYMSSQYPQDNYAESNYPESEFNPRGRVDYDESEYPGDDKKGYYDDDYYEPSEYYQDDYGPQDDTLPRGNDRRDSRVQDRTKRQEPHSKNLQSVASKKSSSDLESCFVSSCTVQKDRWYFIIHAKYVYGQMDILKRSYDDIWALQVTLLSRFPAESGRNNQSRLIPFLQPPEKGVSSNMESETKQELNRYFRDLLFLPASLLQSTYFLKFFTIRVGDLKNTSISTDVGDTLLDLLDDIQDSPMISVKLVLGDEVVSWKEEPGLDFEELMYQCEDRLGFQIDKLLYLDEIDNMTELYGDEDLRLLISFSPNLRFYIQ